MSSQQSTQQASPAAPIYITIGAQCVGKTTLLKKISANKNSTAAMQPIRDITLDEQRGVYIKVPVELYLRDGPPINEMDGADDDDDTYLLDRRIQGKTIRHRIYTGATNAEMRAVLQRFYNRISAQQLEQRILDIYRNHSLELLQREPNNKKVNMTMDNVTEDHVMMQAARELIDAVEDVHKRVETRPQQVDLFVVESLFRPHPKTNRTGTEAAQATLLRLANTRLQQPLAWGNTNARPREYKVALEAAQESGRPVYFLVHGNKMECRIVNGLFLPPLPLSILLRRNLKRLLETGKFIPARAIVETTQRIENLVKTAVHELDRSKTVLQKQQKQQDDEAGDTLLPIHTKLELDMVLAKMVNFVMSTDRRVQYMPPATKRRTIKQRPPRNRPSDAHTEQQQQIK
jgi:hypothetical protein